MKKYISFSGGVESSTMCVLYGKGATAIWVDTGAEHKAMYDRMDKVEEYLKTLHKGDFSLIRLQAEAKYKGQILNSLEDAVIAKKFMPSGQRRYCTADFKIKPIDNFLKSLGEVELMIGFNFDEQGRTGNLEKMKNVKYSYPLVDDGLTRDECEEILHLHGLHPNFPVYMNRGGCRMCFFKSEKEYRAMYYLNPQEFEEVAKFEEAYQDKREKVYAIMGNGKTLRQLAKECQGSAFTNQEMIEMYKAAKLESRACGAFCRR